ncbi:MAG: DUF3140 domain-containing protein [Candidatus Devosia phytovorans]|uniref:DUF3140 domain-containing protein n=1 Tax=Candidatus Devosia phytovorans TaxID=3121372 RepID=A0AAJ6B1D7_9HYPH|nr:DUF3140 domain-containing protein [Devosia sp.]WEK04358.1 MAG: DUF3140 domain-containing protein [Devosia sp.]
MEDEDQKKIRADFADAVNMAPAEIEKWLDTEESKQVGWPKERDGKESVGHHSGRWIIEIKRRPVADLSEADYQHMQKVVGYVHRHLAQRPDGDIEKTPWRYSLMNWGHDPK